MSDPGDPVDGDSSDAGDLIVVGEVQDAVRVEGPVISRECPVCAEGVEGEGRRCERCETLHHADCWDYLGHCAIFGCQPAEASGVPAVAQERSLARTRRVADWWSAVFRVHWGLMLGWTLAWSAAVPAFAVRGAAVTWLLSIGTMLGALYGLLLVPSLGLRRALNERLGEKVTAPSGGARPLLESLALTREGRDARSWVWWLQPLFLVWLGYCYSQRTWWLMTESTFALMGVLALLLVRTLGSVTRERMMLVEVLQNRMAASLKPERRRLVGSRGGPE